MQFRRDLLFKSVACAIIVTTLLFATYWMTWSFGFLDVIGRSIVCFGAPSTPYIILSKAKGEKLDAFTTIILILILLSIVGTVNSDGKLLIFVVVGVLSNAVFHGVRLYRELSTISLRS